MQKTPFTIFIDKLGSAIAKKELVKLVVARPRDPASDLKSLVVTMIEIKAGPRLNFVYHHKTKDITKNYAFDEGLAVVLKSLEEDFFNADLFASAETVQMSVAGRGKVKIRTTPVAPKAMEITAHDHVKERMISTAGNVYLRELGVLNAAFEVRREMSDKFRQINRYIELIGPVIAELPLREGFHVADMGSGKGYLTFALYDYLTRKLGKSPVMTGVETRADLVEQSNRIAEKSGFVNLRFVSGTIADLPLEKIDILIALHACDTATDDAIFRGIASGAALIVCAPCCHKQVRKAFNVNSVLKPVLKHGILEERQAEIITDSVRALIMESQGYQARISEFISTEHTPKNLLITGKKVTRKPAEKKKILESIRQIKELYGIKQHYLEGLLERGGSGR